MATTPTIRSASGSCSISWAMAPPWENPPTTNGPSGACSEISCSNCEREESTSMSSLRESVIRRVASASSSSYLHQVRPRVGCAYRASGTMRVQPSGSIFSAKGRIILASPVMPCIMMSVGKAIPHNSHWNTSAPATRK